METAIVETLHPVGPFSAEACEEVGGKAWWESMVEKLGEKTG